MPKPTLQEILNGSVDPKCLPADNSTLVLLLAESMRCEIPKQDVITGSEQIWVFPETDCVKSFTLIVVSGEVVLHLVGEATNIQYPVGSYTFGQGNAGDVDVSGVSISTTVAGGEAIIIWEAKK